jgi:hypothetical protein
MTRNRFVVVIACTICAGLGLAAWFRSLEDDTRHILFDEPAILAVAIGSALASVGIVSIPYCRFVRSPRARVAAALAASVLASVAVILGDLSFTRWGLYNNGAAPTLGQWIGFALVNAVIGAVAGSFGGLMGFAAGTGIDQVASHTRVG